MHHWQTVVLYFGLVAAILTFWRGKGMSLVDINALEAEALAEVREERTKKAKRQLKEKLQAIEHAELILANLKREKADLLLSIADGTN
jgi:hypothetical protein